MDLGIQEIDDTNTTADMNTNSIKNTGTTTTSTKTIIILYFTLYCLFILTFSLLYFNLYHLTKVLVITLFMYFIIIKSLINLLIRYLNYT